MVSAYLFLLLSQAPAPPEVDVEWSAPAECPGRDVLLGAVARRLGRPLAAGEAKMDARVTGDRVRGYALQLTLSVGGRGEARTVQDPSCAALADAAAVRLVAAIEAPAVVPTPPTPEPAVTPTPEPAVTPTPAPTLEVEPAEPVRTSALPEPPQPVREDRYDGPGGVLRLHGGGEVGALPGDRVGANGALPGPAGAVGLALGLLWPRLRLELQGTVLAPRTGALVRAGLYAGAVHACWRGGRGKLEVPLCGGLELGAMRATGRASGETRTQLWLAAALGPGLSWHVSPRISVWASLQLVVAPVRPRFQNGEGDREGEFSTLFLPSPASGRLLLGVELRIRDRW